MLHLVYTLTEKSAGYFDTLFLASRREREKVTDTCKISNVMQNKPPQHVLTNAGAMLFFSFFHA